MPTMLTRSIVTRETGRPRRTFSISAIRMCPPSSGRNGSRLKIASASDTTPSVHRNEPERTLGPVRAVEQDGQWRMGIQFQATAVPNTPLSFGQAAAESVRWSWTITRESVLGLVRIVTTADGHRQVSSIVGITQVGAESVDSGGFLWMLGLVSLALAIFNLLPFLPLDGGHIVIALAEKLRRGRPLSRILIERISIVGIALVLLLFAIGLNNDLSRFGGP